MDWIDPIRDPRWAHLILRHPKGSVFHTPAWLAALQQTYGYRPIALTSTVGGAELDDGIPFCEVKSWISGSRLVSLPFSDHCQPLLKLPADLADFILCLHEHCGRSTWKYIEIRPMEDPKGDTVVPSVRAESGARNTVTLKGRASSFENYHRYNFHKIDLRSDPGMIFSKFHRDCIQRKIRRAERENLECEAGKSESTLEKFYSLLLLTRRRHGLPPQPMAWFRNLRDCFGENLTIRVASRDGRPIASILTLMHKHTLVYKYGCSDSALHSLGAMPMLFWKAIQEAKQIGAEEFDLGRSEIDNPGLSAFKEHLGAACSKLVYFRHSTVGRYSPGLTTAGTGLQIVRSVFSRLPSPFGRMAGALLYKHIG
jgi:Acetyltransferase (GNAT) domain